jgi:hypothetical protein
MFSANNLSGDESTLGVRFCEPVQNGKQLQKAIDAKGNVAEIEERIRRKDYEQYPPKEDMVRGTFNL